MPQNNFIKQNFVLILGIALPVLLMVGFMVASAIPNMTTPPPQYDMVFSTQDYGGSSQQRHVSVDLAVKDGKLMATYIPTKKVNGNYVYGTYWKKLYIYRARTQTVERLDLPVPDDADTLEKNRTEAVEAAKGMKISAKPEAPDGYSFSAGGYHGGGFMGDVFWGGSHYRHARLVKGSASVALKMDGQDYYYSPGSINFIGWVTGGQE
ncbi:MAG: hypothetical protein GC185_05910 [Alphaproteobacteria bacterium]|nr:hypothetical protein [Alphaproteobacteria bacterium]